MVSDHGKFPFNSGYFYRIVLLCIVGGCLVSGVCAATSENEAYVIADPVVQAQSQYISCSAPCQCMEPSDILRLYGADGYVRCDDRPCGESEGQGLANVAPYKYCVKKKPVIAVPVVSTTTPVPVVSTTTPVPAPVRMQAQDVPARYDVAAEGGQQVVEGPVNAEVPVQIAPRQQSASDNPEVKGIGCSTVSSVSAISLPVHESSWPDTSRAGEGGFLSIIGTWITGFFSLQNTQNQNVSMADGSVGVFSPVRCPPGQGMADGKCQDYKITGLSVCNGENVDTLTDPRNCGSCGNQCNAGQTCSGGKCPGISLSAKPATGTTPLKVTFEILGITGPGGSNNDYQWNFGDGTTGSGIVTEHTYTIPGIYSASLMKSGSTGRLSYATLNIVVKNPSTDNLVIDSPLENERFIVGETPKFLTSLTMAGGKKCSSGPCRDQQIWLFYGDDYYSALQWVSDRDGNLGSGREITITKPLSPGIHTITVSGNGKSATTTIRVYEDLLELYKSEPSTAEVNRIKSDFTIEYIDGTPGVSDEQWNTYDPVQFNQKSAAPSKIVIIAYLDLLRHQQFSGQPPFSSEKTLYDDLKKYTKKIELHLWCYDNHIGFYDNGEVSHTLILNRGMSTWTTNAQVSGGTCKNLKPLPDDEPFAYGYPLRISLLIHENRHNQPDDPKPEYMDCNDWCQGIPRTCGSQKLEKGSGHSSATQYFMWVYKYGKYDTPETKALARQLASQNLRIQFCTKPASSDTRMQVIIDELLKNSQCKNS